jgi:hypothetical protein
MQTDDAGWMKWSFTMKHVVLCLAMGLAGLGSAGASSAWGQASEIQSAAPAQVAGQTQEQKGRKLLDEMVEALGGDAWLNRKNVQETGHLARFFRGGPTGAVVDFNAIRQFQTASLPEAQRIGFLTDKSMILPGKKIDVVQIWKGGQGYEVTFKGKSELPKDQVADFYRRQNHSVESVVKNWLKAPGVMVIAEGGSTVERRLADKVSVLSADNDAVTLELDATTHLPLRRTFQWRNETFNDFDKDAEEYDDYHLVQGLPTAYTVSRYHNDDLTSQTFFLKFAYDVELAPETFNQDLLVKKK